MTLMEEVRDLHDENTEERNLIILQKMEGLPILMDWQN